MSPKPFTENSQHEHTDIPKPVPVQAWMSWRPILAGVLIMLAVTLAILATLWLAFSASARAHTGPKPIPAPPSLTRAREACPNTSSLSQCRGELRKAYAAITWQRHERLHEGAYGVDHAIRLASALYGIPEAQMRSVGACESHLTATSQNRTSTAAGLFQFLDSTWARAGIPGFSVYDPYANAIAAARLVHNDGGWGEWQCRP